MKITYKGDYALKTLFALALNYSDESTLTKINSLSKKLDIPEKYLEALLITLKTGGFVKSKRGKDGGYYLAMPPSEITLGDIIRKVEGPIELVACVNKGYKGCADIADCELKDVFCKVTNAISGIVDEITLQDLVTKRQKRKNVSDYAI